MKNSRIQLIILTLVWLMVHVLLLLHYGIRNFTDTTIYLRVADLLLNNHELEEARYIFYIVPISLLSFFRFIFPDQIVPFIIFQCLVSALALAALYHATVKIFNSTLAGFFSCLIFLLWIDNLHWNITVMTESLLCSIICFILYKLSTFTSSLKDYCGLIILSMLALFTRPTGFIICLGVVSFLLSYHWSNLTKQPLLKYSLLISLFIAGLVVTHVMFTTWDFTDQYKRGNIVTYADLIHEDAIRNSITIIPDNTTIPADISEPSAKVIYFITHNPVYFIKAASLKVWYLISCIRPYYSTWHNIFTLLWMIAIYPLCYLGWRNTEYSQVKVFIITVIILNCILIGISSVDWDNRFYIPMEPGIVLLAGGGLLKSLGQLVLKKQNQSETRKASHSLV